ncbi:MULTISPECIES: acyltransferase [unclassified Pseudoxanthomonas]|uniref:acyltransferase family protein n=1 Tax=unclassified Pseudoxanthomonas TaxID=2645906 RepID=UPI0030789DF8
MHHGTSPSSRVVELDALRGIAALAVVAYHYTTRYTEEIGHLGGSLPSLLAGKYGVHLFFLISGFVIFMTLERARSAMDFVVSRFSRLFPGYWVALTITALVVYSVGLPQQALPWPDLLLNLTMVQDILGAEHLDGSYWTLQVELFFYVQMLFWFLVGQLKRIHWIIAGWLFLSVLNGVVTHRGGHLPYLVRELLILRHIPFFALGILFFRLRSYSQERRLNLAMIALCLLAIAIAEQPIFLLVATVSCSIFTLFVLGRLRFLNMRLFVFLGGISYSLYLIHQAIGFSVIYRLEHAGVSSLIACLLAAGASMGLAVLLSYGVEKPAMRWIRSNWQRRGKPDWQVREHNQRAHASHAACNAEHRFDG